MNVLDPVLNVQDSVMNVLDSVIDVLDSVIDVLDSVLKFEPSGADLRPGPSAIPVRDQKSQVVAKTLGDEVLAVGDRFVTVVVTG